MYKRQVKKAILRAIVKNRSVVTTVEQIPIAMQHVFSQNGKVNKSTAKGEKSKKKRKKSKGRKVVSKEESDSSDSGEYDSKGAVSRASSNRIACRTNARNSVLVKMSSIVADTPRIIAKGYVSKSGRKCNDIKLLPDSGATMPL